jgi:hypothetical protein
VARHDRDDRHDVVEVVVRPCRRGAFGDVVDVESTVVREEDASPFITRALPSSSSACRRARAASRDVP